MGFIPELRMPRRKSQKQKNVKQTVIKIVDRLFEQTTECPGVAVAVCCKGEMVTHCKGLSDLSAKTNVSSSTAFHILSLSRQFFSFATFVLVDQNKISLSDSVSKFFPDWPYKQMTIHHLLSHTSGLADFSMFLRFVWNKRKGCIVDHLSDERPTNADVIDLFCKFQPHLEFEVGSKHSPCNSDYAVLSAIISKVSGQSVEAFLEAEIFSKLGMKHTILSAQSHSPAENPEQYSYVSVLKRSGKFDSVAVGYSSNMIINEEDLLQDLDEESNEDEDEVDGENASVDFQWIESVEHYLNGVTGDSGIISTLDDMILWIKCLNERGSPIISQATWNLATTPFTMVDEQKAMFLLGQEVDEEAFGGKSFEDAVQWVGFTSYVFRLPSTGYFVLVLANSETDIAESIGND